MDYEHYITTTPLRRDPYYTIYYTNWTRLILIGVLPILLLIYFNYKVSLLVIMYYYVLHIVIPMPF